MEEKGLRVKVVRAWISYRVQVNVPSVGLEWAATASSASTGCTRNAEG